MSDAELLEQWNQDQDAGMETLLRKYGPLLRYVIGGVLRDKVTDDHPWRFYVHQFSRSFPALSPNSSVFYTFMNPQQPISDSSRKPMD